MNRPVKSLLRRLMPRSIQSRRILSGPLRGLRIVTSWHDYPAAILGRTEQPLLEWFEKNVGAGQTWLDIGAHYGYTAIALSRLVGAQGRVFAFEPVLKTAGYLAQTRALNNLSQLTVLPFALGGLEDLGLKQLAAERGMADSTKQQTEETETIVVVPLDWLWPRVCGRNDRIDGIKIDVQGMEIQTLEGMAGLCRTFKPKLVVEVHYGVDRIQLVDLMERLGYSRHGLQIEPGGQETPSQYLDDRSYAFRAI